MPSFDLLTALQPDLAVLATNWLALGASSFSFWSDGRQLVAWPVCQSEVTGVLVAPICVGGQAVGELRLAGPAHPGARQQLANEARLLERLLHFENDLDQMTAELIETQDQLLAMYELTQGMRANIGISETLHHLAHESARLLKTEGALLSLGPTIVQYPREHFDERALLGFLLRAQTDGQELLASGAGLPDGITTMCVLPIRVRGSITASLALVNRASGFTAPDLKLARAIAEQTGAQIEHTLLYQETLAQARLTAEMEVARKVQLQLLPQEHPRVPSLQIFAESRPALQVGGDFYDFVVEPERPLMLLLGDVAGKGMPAAMIMSMIHAVTRSAARFMPKATPAALLERMNSDLYEDLTLLDTFTTAFAAQYDAKEHTLRYANAGHAPAIFRPAGGRPRLLEADGVPIGVLPISLSEDMLLSFGPDDLLIVATDGFNESRNRDGEMFGYERLLNLVDEFAGQPAQVIAYALFDAVEEFASGAAQDDDQTLIVVKGVQS